MTLPTRVLVVVSAAAAVGLALARGGPAALAASALQAQAPPPAAPAAQPAGGRAAGPGQAAPQGRGQAPGGRRGGFPQFMRPLPAREVILRGKALYDSNCASCHAPDLRGVPPNGINILRSGVVYRDENGEVIGPALAQHKPPVNFVDTDVVAVAAYLHSMQAQMGGQGSPGRGAAPVTLNVLVGDAKAGEAKFQTYCAKCHSVTGDLRGAGTKYGDARALQNAWVAGAGGRFGGGGGRGGAVGVGNPATVTMADGSKLEGTLVRVDDFLVVLTLPDGTRKSMARVKGVPKVEVKDPQEAHKKMVLEIDDPANQNMYDITAYLATIK